MQGGRPGGTAGRETSAGAVSGERGGPAACSRCACALAGRASDIVGGERRCLSCAIRHRPLLARSALTAFVVGTILVAINQGNLLVASAFPAAELWKIPLTYAVPFYVATWGALGNSRRRGDAGGRGDVGRAEDDP